MGAVGYAALYPAEDRPGPRGRTPSPLSPPMLSGRARARANAAARRRLVMTVLVAAFAIPTLVALATGATAAWWVAVVMLPLACTYACVVVRARRVMAEKEFNVAFLGGTHLAAPGLEEIFAPRPGAAPTASIDLRDRRPLSAGLGR